MKKVLFLIVMMSSFLVAKDLWIYNIKTDLLDPKTKEIVGEIYEGSPVTFVKKDGDFSLIKVKGVTNSLDQTMLIHKNDSVSGTPLVSFLKLKNGIAKNGDKFLVKSADLIDKAYPAWEEIELVYYDTCTSCHAGHHPTEHLMNEWDAYLSAMQYFAKINDNEKARILRFLEAFAKDGFVKDEY